MDYEAIDFWWKVFVTLINAMIGIYLWHSRRDRATATQIEALSGHLAALRTDLDVRMDDARSRMTRLEVLAHPKPAHDVDTFHNEFGNRVVALEQRMDAAPNRHDLDRVHHRIDEVAGALRRIEGESASQTRILNLVYESLISDK